MCACRDIKVTFKNKQTHLYTHINKYYLQHCVIGHFDICIILLKSLTVTTFNFSLIAAGLVRSDL